MTLGRPPLRSGLQVQGERSTDVPLRFLQHLKLRPLPITVGGTSNRVFTLNGGVTGPAVIWNGDDLIYLKSTVVYTWTTSGTQAVLGSDGAETTEGAAAQTVGIYYMYIDEDGQNILPSQTAPSYVETSFNTGVLGHPGTARAQNWTYVGFMICDATTPTFVSAVKRGFTYHVPSASTAYKCISSWLVNHEFGVFIPDLGAQGLSVGGYALVDVGVLSSCFTTIRIGGDSNSCFGTWVATAGAGPSVIKRVNIPFSDIVPASSGYLYNDFSKQASAGVSATDPTISITSIVDVV